MASAAVVQRVSLAHPFRFLAQLALKRCRPPPPQAGVLSVAWHSWCSKTLGDPFACPADQALKDPPSLAHHWSATHRCVGKEIAAALAHTLRMTQQCCVCSTAARFLLQRYYPCDLLMLPPATHAINSRPHLALPAVRTHSSLSHLFQECSCFCLGHVGLRQGLSVWLLTPFAVTGQLLHSFRQPHMPPFCLAVGLMWVCPCFSSPTLGWRSSPTHSLLFPSFLHLTEFCVKGIYICSFPVGRDLCPTLSWWYCIPRGSCASEDVFLWCTCGERCTPCAPYSSTIFSLIPLSPSVFIFNRD